MSRHRPALRRPRGAIAFALVLTGLGTLALVHAVTGPDGPVGPVGPVVLASAELTSAPLGSPHGGPLFSVAGLTPGHPVTRCVTVTGVGASTPVRFAVDTVQGTLAAYLLLTVTPGTGSDGSCADFVATGSAVFSGTLDAPSVAATAGGISTGWIAADGDTRTFELAVDVVDNQAAFGAAATADFVWSTGTPPVQPSPVAPTVTTTVTPTASPSAGTTRPPTAQPIGTPTHRLTGSPTPVTGTPTNPASSSSPPPTAGPQPQVATSTPVPRTAGTPTGSRTAGVGTGTTTRPPDDPATSGGRAEQIRNVAIAVVRQGSFPLLLLVLVVLYLFIQNRIDRSDPKLVAAPVRSTPEQELPDEGAVPWQIS